MLFRGLLLNDGWSGLRRRASNAYIYVKSSPSLQHTLGIAAGFLVLIFAVDVWYSPSAAASAATATLEGATTPALVAARVMGASLTGVSGQLFEGSSSAQAKWNVWPHVGRPASDMNTEHMPPHSSSKQTEHSISWRASAADGTTAPAEISRTAEGSSYDSPPPSPPLPPPPLPPPL